MRKQEIMWVAALLLLGGIYVHFFTHWFEKKSIVITPSLRPSRRADSPIFSVYFTLNGEYKLTSLKVVPLQDGTLAPSATPVWDLVAAGGSAPTRAFRYGQHIGGMKPALAGVQPEALNPDVVYRITLTAGDVMGSKDFKTKAATP